MNGVTAAITTKDVVAQEITPARFACSTGRRAPWTKTNRARYTFSRTDSNNIGAYSNHSQGRFRRTAASSSTVSHTAASTENAYERASMPAHVVLGRIANATPAHTATDRVENRLAKTTTPAAAPATARPLGTRAQN